MTCRLWVEEQTLDTATSTVCHLRPSGMMASICGSHVGNAFSVVRRLQGACIVRFGRPPISSSKVEKAKQGLAAGKGVRQVARLAGISPASCSRIKSALAPCISCPHDEGQPV